jgi:chorismate-pyruvate lyase
MRTSGLTTAAGSTDPQEPAWRRLGPLARVLLASDGTLTDLLEAMGGEPVVVRKLREEALPVREPGGPLDLDHRDWLIERIALLHGARSGQPLVHARVLLAANRLTGRFRDDLLRSDAPIGHLWRRHRIELFREPIGRALAPAGAAGYLLDCDAATLAWSRTSRVQERGRPVMLVTETFAPALVARAG